MKTLFTAPLRFLKRVSTTPKLRERFLFAALFAWSAYATGSFIAAQKVIETQQAQMEESALLAKLSVLETEVATLKATNKTIIAQVKEKASFQVAELESIIKSTGVNAEKLKKQFADRKPAKNKNQGGPFIPAETMLPAEGKDMINTLEEAKKLKRVLGALPLATPIKNAEMMSPFGTRSDPITGRLALHSGIDLSAADGAKIYSTGSGKVVFAGYSGAYGNTVDVDHGYGLVTRYGHLKEINVEVGQQVFTGDSIGIQGATGRATGPHLHYEVRYNNQPLNPKRFLDAGRSYRALN